MQRQIIEVGSFAVNCSIVQEKGSVFIIDPGSESDRIKAYLAGNNITPSKVLLTHAHFDHIGGIAGLQSFYPHLEVFVHPRDVFMFGHPLNAYEPDYPIVARPKNLRDARELDGVEVLETPGHTPGGVSYYFREAQLLFSGDTLFARSVGRTDLPGGDMSQLLASLDLLKTLPDATTVVPGHGPETTMAIEKRENVYLR